MYDKLNKNYCLSYYINVLVILKNVQVFNKLMYAVSYLRDEHFFSNKLKIYEKMYL